MIDRRMALTGITNRRAYLLKMATEGQVVHLELDGVKEMVRLLSNATNNMNQIAKRANETRSIFESDIKDLQAHYDGLWEQAETILKSLANIQK